MTDRTISTRTKLEGATLEHDDTGSESLTSGEALIQSAEQLQDADDEIMLAVEQTAALVAPVLKQIFQAAATNDDLWLKKRSVKHLSQWIQSTQDIADVLYQTNQAMQEVISAQEQELQELRPVKKKVWTPFS